MNAVPASDIWQAPPELVANCNLTALIRAMGFADYDAFLKASVERPQDYWAHTLRHFGIEFDPPADQFVDVSKGPMWARYFPGAGFNIAAACLRPPQGENGADQPAVLAEDEQGATTTLSYKELSARTRAFAAGLKSVGVKQGDRVGLFYPSSAEAVVTLLAICYIGAIVVPLYSGFGADAVARRLLDSGATFLAAADSFERKGKSVPIGTVAAEAVASMPSCQLILSYADAAKAPAIAHHRWQDLARSTPEVTPAPTAADDPFMVIYTSGTSGKPKGAVHRHAGFPLRVAQDTAFVFDFKAGDRYFWPSDMGWMVGPFSTFAALINKGALVLYSGSPDYPDIGRLRATSIRQKVTHFGTTPTAIRAMAAAESVVMKDAAPDLRILMTGGEVIDTDAHNWLVNTFGGGELPLINYSGGTECSGAILTNVVLRPIAPCRFNSATPGVDGRVIDEQGNSLVGVPGELAIHGPFNGMTAGFWGDPDRYVETYWSRVPGFWVHGDLTVREADGQHLLLGRSDDVMKVSGRRVGPSEIEGIVVDGRIVADAVAFGVPDFKTGEAMIILAVPGPDAGADPERVKAFVAAAIREKMGASFRAHEVLTMPELIKTRNGKLVRRLARQAWLGQEAGDLTSVENPAVFEQVRARCAELHKAA